MNITKKDIIIDYMSNVLPKKIRGEKLNITDKVVEKIATKARFNSDSDVLSECVRGAQTASNPHLTAEQKQILKMNTALTGNKSFVEGMYIKNAQSAEELAGKIQVNLSKSKKK